MSLANRKLSTVEKSWDELADELPKEIVNYVLKDYTINRVVYSIFQVKWDKPVSTKWFQPLTPGAGQKIKLSCIRKSDKTPCNVSILCRDLSEPASKTQKRLAKLVNRVHGSAKIPPYYGRTGTVTCMKFVNGDDLPDCVQKLSEVELRKIGKKLAIFFNLVKKYKSPTGEIKSEHIIIQRKPFEVYVIDWESARNRMSATTQILFNIALICEKISEKKKGSGTILWNSFANTYILARPIDPNFLADYEVYKEGFMRDQI